MCALLWFCLSSFWGLRNRPSKKASFNSQDPRPSPGTRDEELSTSSARNAHRCGAATGQRSFGEACERGRDRGERGERGEACAQHLELWVVERRLKPTLWRERPANLVAEAVVSIAW